MRRPLLFFFALCACPAQGFAHNPAEQAASIDFDRQVAPLLAARCLECHRGDDPQGDLDLSRRQGVLQGALNGPAVTPGDLAASSLWQRVAHDEMPPDAPLNAEEREVLRAWILAGAPWGADPIDFFAATSAARAGYDWWAFRPLVRPAFPRVVGVSAAGHPVDRFVVARLEAEGLRLNPPADRRTLIRRASFDLVGMPPSPDEAANFVNDRDPRAWEKVVDRLLSSPHYGERWARHWLDVARYGETDGFERNARRPYAWPYRDWLIRALNDDMPYTQFCQWQVAGDVVAPDNPDAIFATGFLVAGVHNTVLGNDRMRAVARQDELEDKVGGVGQAFLGLTIHCARCHDHKFDPMSQIDFYRMASALSGVQPGEREITVLPPASPASATSSPVEPQKLRAYAVVSQQPPPTRFLTRGDVAQPAAIVAPGGLAWVASAAEFGLPPDAPEGERRRSLAHWLTHRDNRLFPRVLVNRAWAHHMGVGLVETPSDFGFNGGRPSHPELLDWLALEFIETGYRWKILHRLILTSAAYCQSSRPHAAGLARDAEARWLWRRRPMRLDAESLRDALLAVSGELNDERGGEGFSDYRVIDEMNGTAYYEPYDPAERAAQRRTVYRFAPRGANQGMLDVFDCPDPAAAAPRRNATTTPLQALSLWNGAFPMRMAASLARRAERESPAGVGGQIERMYQLALQRSASHEELEAAGQLAATYGLRSVARVLLNSNEFLTIE